jgi:electron transport complex protein RnfA
MIDIMILTVFSGFSLNLLLQTGLGIRTIGAHRKRLIRYTFFQYGILFASVLLFWLLFSYILTPLGLGYLEYFLLFPLITAAGKGFEALNRRFLPFGTHQTALVSTLTSEVLSGFEFFSPVAAYDGLIITAVILTLRLAGSFAEAAALSLGFSLGSLIAVIILGDIHRRSSLERVPHFLRGMPLLLISMGLMSLIFSSVAAILLQIPEGR